MRCRSWISPGAEPPTVIGSESGVVHRPSDGTVGYRLSRVRTSRSAELSLDSVGSTAIGARRSPRSRCSTNEHPARATVRPSRPDGLPSRAGGHSAGRRRGRSRSSASCSSLSATDGKARCTSWAKAWPRAARRGASSKYAAMNGATSSGCSSDHRPEQIAPSIRLETWSSSATAAHASAFAAADGSEARAVAAPSSPSMVPSAWRSASISSASIMPSSARRRIVRPAQGRVELHAGLGATFGQPAEQRRRVAARPGEAAGELDPHLLVGGTRPARRGRSEPPGREPRERGPRATVAGPPCPVSGRSPR